MAAGDEQGKAGGCGVDGDLYAVLGLQKECSAADLRSAYKKLALTWHPDRCSALCSSKIVDEAKTKFQAIQEAYSVLSDTNKRFLYDVGVYDNDEDEESSNGMGQFLGEMAAMMSQATNHKPNAGGGETFEELQELFVEMFQTDMDAFYCGGGSTPPAASARVQRGGVCDRPSTSSTTTTTTTTPAASFYGSCRAAGAGSLKRDSADMCSGKAKAVVASDGDAGLGPGGTFCVGTHDRRNGSSSTATRGRAGTGNGKRRSGRKPKASSPQHNGGPSSSQGDGETWSPPAEDHW